MMNKTKNECETNLCNYSSTPLTRFYNGMLLTDEHLRAEQKYFRDALRRLTRHLFGWGVVCGLEVVEQRGLCIKITPGVAIDCCGNLIEVCKCITVNLAKECEDRYGECEPEEPAEPIRKYLVLRYVEKETDPEPVLTPPDDCALPEDKPSCQASKIREGYCLELWDRCPCTAPEAEPEKGLLAYLLERTEKFQEQQERQTSKQPARQQLAQQSRIEPVRGRGHGLLELIHCEPCACCENAVGIGEVEIDCANNTVKVGLTCRRDVISPRLLDAIYFRVENDKTRQIASLHRGLAYTSTANVVASAVEYEADNERIRRLEDQVAQLNKTVTRLSKKPTSSSTQKPE